MNVTVYLGASSVADEMYSIEAASLGKWIGESGHRLIYGGSRVGLMGVLADAVLAAGGEVIGVEPSFLIEKEVQHEGITELIATDTMAERRSKMIELADAFIAFPGGTGTLEETAEVMSLKKLGQIDKPIAILNIEGYFDSLRHMLEKMVEEGFLDRQVLEGIYFAKSVEAAGWHIEHKSTYRYAYPDSYNT